MHTLRLKQLIDQVLESLPQPYTVDVIEDAFNAIENNEMWRKTYDQIVYKLGKPMTNAWGGFWIAHSLGKLAEPQAAATRGTLLDSYAKLVKPAEKRAKKVKEPEAVRLMHDHYQAHRDHLPAAIKDHREVIVALIMGGIAPEIAFSKALEKPAFAR